MLKASRSVSINLTSENLPGSIDWDVGQALLMDAWMPPIIGHRPAAGRWEHLVAIEFTGDFGFHYRYERLTVALRRPGI